MLNLILLAGALQIFGTLLTGLFSIKGLSIDENEAVRVGGKSITTVSVNKGYLWMAKAGIVMLLIGIFLSALASMMPAYQ